MPTINLVISQKAKEKFDAVKNRLNKDQNETATQIFERMDVKSFDKVSS